jgi:hypothetical protein
MNQQKFGIDESMPLAVFYWPEQDLILVEGFNTTTGEVLFEAPNVTNPQDSRKWLWTALQKKDAQRLVKIGEL